MTKKCSNYSIKSALILCVMNLMLPLGETQNSRDPGNQTEAATRPPLRIAVPVRAFYYGFVTIKSDPTTGDQNFTGFAIDVFNAVNRALLERQRIRFIPFSKPDGTMNGTFDDMLKAVNSQDYDGAVGDISIVDYRTDWVDFTLPFMETGISMLVPLKQQQQIKDKGISLIRVTKGFVAATIAFSFMATIAFWILEHRNDKHASQPASRSNDDNWRREILGSIIQTRLVMILLFMMLLVFIACYAASQTSSLSSQSRQSGGFKNLNQLIRKGAKVGYQQGSFIKNLLILRGLQESQLVAFNSGPEMLDMLSKPPDEGGIAAVVALTSNLKLLQAQSCDAFTIVPTFNLRTAGFGFAFRRESSLVREFSNGILKLIYNGQLGRIQERTIGSLDKCDQDEDQISGGGGSNQLLDTDTLWILVAGAIGVLLLMLIIFLVHAGITCNSTRKKKVIAYPCYLFPCC